MLMGMVARCAGAFLFRPRLLRFVATVVVAGACAMNPANARARTLCDTVSDPEARALMARLEHDFRHRPRIARMQIGTIYGEGHPLARHFKGEPYEKTLWGIFNGDADETWLLYTFSAPGRLAGTSLLMRDFADPTIADSMWLYLRAFDRFSKLESAAQRVMVPGTALTYEDSRGFIPLDKYEFSFDAGEHDEKTARLIACPKNADVRENLAYSSLGLTLDRAKGLVRHVVYRDLGGKPLKTYELMAEQWLEPGWVPSRVRITHLTDGYTTEIAYEHWALDTSPPQALYEPETDDEKFLVRLERVLKKAGLGERIEAEIAAANELIRAYDEKAAVTGKAAGAEPQEPAP